MGLSRRAMLETGPSALSLVVLAGCTAGNSGDRSGGDDASKTNTTEPDAGSTPESANESANESADEPDAGDDRSEESDEESLVLLVEPAVEHGRACGRAEDDDLTPLEASSSVEDAPTVDRTGEPWDVTYSNGSGHVVFDADAHSHSSYAFYTANGLANPVTGTEREWDTIDACASLDAYLVVEPEDGRVVLELTSRSDLDVDHPEEYPDVVDDANGTETGRTDDHGYETYAVEGKEIPLAPLADVYEWYENDDVTMVDARSRESYERLHIAGAVSSPAPDGQESNDPLEDVPTDARIVTYCPCPHTLAGYRAASLVEEGYTEVYALKEGLQRWVERGYPVEGTDAD